jgi:hypothetical protein
MDANNEALDRSKETVMNIAEALRSLADDVEDGNCNDPNIFLFDADIFNVCYQKRVMPFVKSVIDNQKMD